MSGVNHRPSIFIGSSSEQRAVADTLKTYLDDLSECTVWYDAFPLSQTTLDSVITAINQADFAVFIFSDDDLTTINKQQFATARDNVIFEAGLSIGAPGRKRTFVVVPADATDYHILSDLHGVTTTHYNKGSYAVNKMAAMEPVALEIKSSILHSLWRKLELSLDTKLVLDYRSVTTYKLKVFMTLVNKEIFPITCEAHHFVLTDFRIDQKGAKTKKYKPEFFLYQSQEGDSKKTLLEAS
jgi:hypothetical protein